MARAKYWENEQPQEVNTGRNRIRFFREARRLQVCMADWQDEHGETRQGKTVGVDLAALEEAEPEELQRAAAIFAEIAGNLESAAAVVGSGPQ